MVEPSDNGKQSDWLVEISIYASIIVGLIALLLALVSFLGGQFQAAGTCLVAAAIAFGALANTLLRG